MGNWKATTLLIYAVALVLKSGYCEITELKSNSITQVPFKSSLDGPSLLRRSRRSLPSKAEISEILNVHNELRRKEGASNMEQMKWNAYLANMGEDWAKTCVWEHGQPSRDPNSMPYKKLGQNLYGGTAKGAINLTNAIVLWYDEKKDYNYNTLTCKPGKMCGHYTQVVWSNSFEVGCAYAKCPNLKKVNIANAYYLVCNYGPPGNFMGEKPFLKGSSCTECETGSFFCAKGLCNRACSSTGPDCECSAKCANCGTVKKSTCSCSCAPGWFGASCSTACGNFHKYCNPKPGVPGWPPSMCNHAQQGETIRKNCPAMCKVCEEVTGPKKTCKRNSDYSEYTDYYSESEVLMDEAAFQEMVD